MQSPPGTTRSGRWRRRTAWELVTCGTRGHELVGADAKSLRPQDGLLVRESQDVRWHRCLRCDSWVPLTPPEQPTREFPPDREQIEVPLRGKALRDRITLRVIACDRAFHFVILVLLGIGVLAFAGHEVNLRADYYRILTALQGGVAGGPVQASGHVGITHELDRLFSLQSGRLHELGLALLAFGVLEGVEAVGLWWAKRWAEYLTFIATTLLLPLEVYEIIHRQTPLKIIGFIINVAIVIYLLFAKRLFGLRGGGAAEAAERAADVSWEALERTTPPGGPPEPAAAPASA
jgi:uncharacterized membrane protein (DUF2068 family)